MISKKLLKWKFYIYGKELKSLSKMEKVIFLISWIQMNMKLLRIISYLRLIS